jgi:protein gp37
MANRLKAMGVRGYENGFKLSLMPDRLEQPLKRKKATTYFVNSMSDLFHEDVPDSYIDQVLAVMVKTPQHTYQVLTKRGWRLPQFFESRTAPENLWLGVSVEDKKYGVPRIDELRKVTASVRFLSAEPLLEDLGELNLEGIHWVIVGGESGKGARPMHPQWAANIQHQCETQNVAFFFKQWGGWGQDGKKRSKKANGRDLNGRTYDQYPLISHHMIT